MIRYLLAAADGGTIMPAPEDNEEVLCALRLGWGLAELRGRNRPGGPPGDIAQMPDHGDHALPLRIERGDAELRIEVQSVVAALAIELHVDHSADQASFGAALDGKAKILGHVRAPTASAALQQALELLQIARAEQLERDDAVIAVTQALSVLQGGLAAQRAVVAGRMQAVAAARQALAEADKQLAEVAGHPAEEQAAAAAARRAAAVLQVELDTVTGEAHGLAALDQIIETLQQATDAIADAGIEAIQRWQQAIATDAGRRWADLAELIWTFDAHLQDGLTAASESQAIAYQLGRGLAETYWALDPDQAEGTMSWSFLLGEQRCGELSRLVGRLSAYLDEYTAAAIAGSVEVWKDVAKTPAWLGDPRDARQALYRQIRRWFELLILGQDPTTLVKPTAVMRDYRTLGRAMQIFWPQLVATAIGLGFLVTLLVLVNLGSGASWAKTASGILALAGLSLAGLTGTLKNSAQAMLKRLRQDAYTDLVTIAVQTAPPPPKKSDLQTAIRQRALTPATPN
jgi:hypothetical protein